MTCLTIIRLDSVFQALSDPTRRAIVQRLTAALTPVSELARPLGMSLPVVMQHLQVLEDSGRVRICRIERRIFMSAEKLIDDRRESWDRHLDVLGEHLASAPEAPTKQKKL